MPQKKIVKKFNYPIELIEKLILDIDEYKKFLPWCSDSRIVSKKENENKIDIIADLEIGYSFAKDIYTSSVNFDKVNKKFLSSKFMEKDTSHSLFEIFFKDQIFSKFFNGPFIDLTIIFFLTLSKFTLLV